VTVDIDRQAEGPSTGYNTFMALPSPAAPVWIDTPEPLADWIAAQRHTPRLAIDTESNSLHAYQEHVCLIQVSTPQGDALIDPLGSADMAALSPLFASPSIEKVFHGAEYDLACLKRDFGYEIVNLFDTRLALRTLGMQPSGLADVLAQEFGVTLDKRFQRADWAKRPLPPAQIEYARFDTHYLLPLRDRLADALQRVGRWEEAVEACAHLACTVHPGTNGDPAGFWGLANARRLEPRQAAALRELYAWRDQTARQLDRPPFKVIGDEALLSLAREQPQDADDLRHVPDLPPRLAERHAIAILAALERARSAVPPHPPSSEPTDPAVLARYDKLRRWRKAVAAERGVESDIILPREVLWEVARVAPRTMQGFEPLMACLPWRLRAYGPAMLTCLWGIDPATT
jgi:ribonuclease D